MRWTLGLLVTSLAASGCYQSHANSEGGLPDAAFLDGDPHGLDARRDAREDAFPPGACMRDDQCAPPIAACARARCFDVSCIVQEIPGACPLGSTCDFERGCVPRAEDGSVRDAFLPDAARTDVGFPDSAPFDAGFRDMGFPDMGFPDAARPDAGSPDAFVGDAGPPPTSSAIRCTSGTVLRALDHPQLDFGPTATFELWIRARAAGTIAIKGRPGTGIFMLRIEGSGAATEIVGGWTATAGERVIRAPFAAQMGRWAHVALVQQDRGDTVDLAFIIDDALVATTTVADDFASAANSLDFRICTIDADLDEIRLWRFARDVTSTVSDLRRMLPSGITGLSVYWPLEERGQVVLDRSLHGAEGVLGETTDVEAVDPLRITDGAF